MINCIADLTGHEEYKVEKWEWGESCKYSGSNERRLNGLKYGYEGVELM